MLHDGKREEEKGVSGKRLSVGALVAGERVEDSITDTPRMCGVTVLHEALIGRSRVTRWYNILNSSYTDVIYTELWRQSRNSTCF